MQSITIDEITYTEGDILIKNIEPKFDVKTSTLPKGVLTKQLKDSLREMITLGYEVDKILQAEDSNFIELHLRKQISLEPQEYILKYGEFDNYLNGIYVDGLVGASVYGFYLEDSDGNKEYLTRDIAATLQKK